MGGPLKALDSKIKGIGVKNARRKLTAVSFILVAVVAAAGR